VHKNFYKDVPYAERLAASRAIGSGLIEGACKNLIGKWMKQTGACWRVPRASRIATLCAALYSNQWKMYHNYLGNYPVESNILFLPSSG